MKKFWKRLSIIALGGTVLALVLFFFSIWYTNRSDFCTTCHYMQPFYDAWASSSHNMVPCRECHYEPGYDNVVKGKIRDINQLVKYWTNAYRRSKPWAEISDASCLRSGCHETRLLEGKVLFEKVNFDHGPHLKQMRRGKKLRCTSCHSQIVQGEHMTVTETTCILCHFKFDENGNNKAECRICHDPPIAEEGKEPPKFDHSEALVRGLECERCHGSMVVGDGVVPKERCFACHWDRERLDQFQNTDLLHEKHITENKIECDLCHHSTQHKSVHKEQAMPECQTCHTDFHELQKDLFVGHGGVGVSSTPNPMFEVGLSCQSCHLLHGGNGEMYMNGRTLTASGESCEQCHGQGYSRILENWQKAIRPKMATIGEALDDAKRYSTTGLEAVMQRKADSLLSGARQNYDMVRMGKPIHNIVYANALLEAAYDRLADYFSLVASDYQLASIDRSEQIVPGDCINCHIGIEEIDARVFGIDYSHRRHVVDAELQCSTCHSNQRTHGELVVRRDDCLSCHHSQEARECGYCHDVQLGVLAGESSVLPITEPDIMHEVGVGCRDCHELPDRSIVRPVPQRCADCHDEEVVEMQREWLAEFADMEEQVRVLLSQVEDAIGDAGDDPLLATVRDHLRALARDGSRGTHNHPEQMQILEEDKAALEERLAAL